MITIDGRTYPSHKEYFEKYPHKVYMNKRRNLPLYLEAVNKPCADCGFKWHPAVMTLGHINRDGYRNHHNKRVFPSNMIGYPTDVFIAELTKCEAVCANCHQVREMERDGHLTLKKWAPYSKLPRRGAFLP